MSESNIEKREVKMNDNIDDKERGFCNWVKTLIRKLCRLFSKSDNTQESDIERREVQMNNASLFPALIAFMEEGHTISLTLRGFSMRPFLEDKRDTAELRKARNPQIGEPVLAEVAPGHYVLHRLIEINGENVTLLGDGNLAPEHCRYCDIKAQVVGFYRKGRKKMDTVDGKKWRYYSWIWMHLRPVRRWLLAFYRRWVRVFGAI